MKKNLLSEILPFNYKQYLPIFKITQITISLLLFFTCFAFADNAKLQNTRVNLNKQRAALKYVLDEIEQQTDYLFVSNREIDLEQRVSIHVRNKPVNVVLDQLFDNTELTYATEGVNIILSKKIAAPEKEIKTTGIDQQKRTITGQVVDMNGESIIGANVVEKGATNGMITDIDGNFSLRVDHNTVLLVSYIGYVSQEIPVKNKSSIKITLLEDHQALEEVVVVGYGTQRKITLTGSVASVKGDDIVKSPAGNVASSLAGRLPGLIINTRSGEPGRDDPSILVRGRGTTGNTSALIMIDGVEMETRDLSNINPNDIADITVLKDASAAIYGARAANGVILVTTKRGEMGAPRVNFSYNQGFSQPIRKPNMADSYTFAKVYNEIEAYEGRSPRYTDVELQKYKDGSDPDNYPNYDWYDYMIRDWTPQHRTNLSISGGNERSRYFISIGEQAQEGTYKKGTLEYKTYNVRSNIDAMITSDLKVGLNISGRYSDGHYPYEDQANLNSHIYLYQPNWHPYWPGTDYLYPNRDSENILNWVSDKAGYHDEKNRFVNATGFAIWDIPWVKGLSVDGSINYIMRNNFRKTLRTPTYVYRKEKNGDYTKVRSGSGVDRATVDERADFSSMLYLTAKINYTRKFGEHNVSAMVGYEQTQHDNNWLQAGRTNFISSAIPQIFAGSAEKNNQSNNGSAGKFARQNIFGRLTYDYASKYMAVFTLRRDGSPNFPENKRVGIFPSISAGWRLSEEAFMKKLDFLDNLKIRGSFGVVGNDLVASFQYLTAYGFGNNYVVGNNDVLGLVESNVPNPNITWETAKTWNIGLDATLWQGLLGVEFDLFTTRREDILLKRRALVPDYTGLTLPDENIGIVDNKGFELTLSHAKNQGDISYSVSGNVSFARNKVVFSDEEPAAESYQLAKGKPMYAGLYYNAIGIYKDQTQIDATSHLAGAAPGDIVYEDVNKDGEINSLDRVRQKLTDIPEYVFGLNLYFRYKQFDISALLQGQANAVVNLGGGWFPVMSYAFGNFTQWRADDRWSYENTDASMPRASYDLWNTSSNSTYNSTHWNVNADFLKLKNLEVGYNLPRDVCDKLHLSNLRVSVSGNNLWIIFDNFKKLGFDPETTSFWFYQPQRVFNFGVNVSF